MKPASTASPEELDRTIDSAARWKQILERAIESR
jgi:hypothetical protein